MSWQLADFAKNGDRLMRKLGHLIFISLFICGCVATQEKDSSSKKDESEKKVRLSGDVTEAVVIREGF